MRNQHGSALVQYLMFIALVSAIAVPIFLDRFGQPLIQTFQNERSKFVTIIGQTPRNRRKPPVPAEWFSKAPVSDIETGQIEGGQELKDGGEIQTGEISPGSEIRTGQIGGGNGAEGGQSVQTGNIQSGSDFGRYAGAGSSASGGSAGGDDFFSKPPATPGTKRGEGGAEEDGGGGGGARRSSGAGSDEQIARGGEESVSGGKKNQQDKSKNEGDGTKVNEGKKRSLVEAEEELNDRAKAKKFDWWLILKILIVILIVALVFLILIGNSRR